MQLDRTYLIPTVYAGLVHLLVLVVVSGVWIGQQSPDRERPRHIQATMVDLDQLANMNAAQQQAQETELNRQREEAAAEQRRQAAAEQQRQEQLAQERRVQEQAEADARAREEAARRAEEKAAQEAERIAQERAAAEQRALDEAAAREREAQLRAETERKQQEAERRAAEEARAAEQRRQAEEQRRREEAARAEAARVEQERQRAEAARAAEEARVREEAAQRRAAAEQRANQVVGDIQSYIQSELTRNWRIPATARDGMQAIIAINLFPSGQVDQVYVHESSGDQAFDRSAVQAVQRVGQFSRVADVDPVLFERRLRKVLVTFRPEGLRW